MLDCIFFGIFYTKGRYALAYTGLADFICWLYFGPIAVLGTSYLLCEKWLHSAFFLGCITGCLSVAILTVNNLRDQQEDYLHHKRTLVVRFGKKFGKIWYTLMILFPFLCLPLINIDAYFTYMLLLPGIVLIRKICTTPDYQLNPYLAYTAGYHLLFTTGLVFI